MPRDMHKRQEHMRQVQAESSIRRSADGRRFVYDSLEAQGLTRETLIWVIQQDMAYFTQGTVIEWETSTFGSQPLCSERTWDYILRLLAVREGKASATHGQDLKTVDRLCN